MIPVRETIMIRSSSILGALAACLAFAGAVANAQEANPVLRHPANDAAEGRVLVKFRDSGATSRVQAQAATDKVAALATRTGIRFRSSRTLGPRWHVVDLDPTVSTPEQLVRILADNAVEYATIDRRRYPHALPNDPLYPGTRPVVPADQRDESRPRSTRSRRGIRRTGSDGVVIADHRHRRAL